MATDNLSPQRWYSLAGWADVDPARHSFDPAGAPAIVRSLAPPVPAVPLAAQDAAWPDDHAAREDAFQWNMAMTDALVGHYGAWAYGWHWSLGVDDYVGELVGRWDFWAPISTSPAETLLLVADALVEWRRWLENLAERFDRFLPRLQGVAEQGEIVAVWETAIAHLMTTTVARVEDEDGWQAWCARVLTWFLNAAGVPEQRSAALVNRALGARFDGWVRLSVADVADVAERLAREVAGLASGGIPRAGQGGDDWPDTWPDGWPSWRATNLPRVHS
ncbi:MULTISPECIES: hypothetical protein [unclassified Micromonospora]|uniref:hypothetical protein n=1 Tax=unclassified Micromonospora TaxID=2617518 RepID=UPI003332FDD2